MAQTFGSQIFGPWYDVIGWIIGSGLFFYFAVAVESMPLTRKNRFPPFLLSKKFCIILGCFLAAMGIYNAINIKNYSSRDTSLPPVEKNWLRIDSSMGDSLFIAPDSISKKGDLVEYWSKITFKVPRQIFGNRLQASELIDQFSADCKNRKISHLSSFVVSDKEQIINFPITDEDRAFLPVPSVRVQPNAILFRYVCGGL
jgi:hypothetical protein